MNEQDNLHTLWEQIKDIHVAMLTTVDEDGTLRSRPMATQSDTQQSEFDGDLWFFTTDPSGKSEEIRHDQQVNLSYADPGSARYVSISGRAMIVHDKAKLRDLWDSAYKTWFPNGLDTPDLALVRVTVEKAEYWDAPSAKLVQLAVGAVEAAQAVAAGDRHDTHTSDGTKNEKITLR